MEKGTDVTQENSIFVTKLQDDLHMALKLWHQPNTNSTPLNDLFFFRQTRRKTNNIRQATNQVVLAALQALENEHSQLAHFLRLRFLDELKMSHVANQLNIAEGTAYRRQREAINQLAESLLKLEHQIRNEYQARLENRLNLPHQTDLVGVTPHLQTLLNKLTAPGPPWLLTIEGLGGIGKTALANVLIRTLALTDYYQAVAWINAKQQEFLPAAGLQPTNQPALSLDTLINNLLIQLEVEVPPAVSAQEKLTLLTRLLKDAPYLIVIDNLETALDHQALLPTLNKLANPSRFLLTSRHSLKAHSDIYCFSIPTLSRADTFTFLKQEAQLRHIAALAGATQNQLESIYQVVGGNPLALKLILGQIRLLPLAQVLENLRQAQGKKIDALYTHIYWQAWQTLDLASQHVLLMMPLAQEGDFDHLAAISNLDVGDLNDALDHLITYSLVEVSGSLEDRRYRIHRLTETFLLTEVTKWQAKT